MRQVKIASFFLSVALENPEFDPVQLFLVTQENGVILTYAYQEYFLSHNLRFFFLFSNLDNLTVVKVCASVVFVFFRYPYFTLVINLLLRSPTTLDDSSFEVFHLTWFGIVLETLKPGKEQSNHWAIDSYNIVILFRTITTTSFKVTHIFIYYQSH